MPSGLKLKVRLSESDGCMTKAQRLNTHDLPTTSQRSEWLRRGAFFRLWECFLEFSHTFSLIWLHLGQRNQHSHWWLSWFFFFIVHYKPSICEEAHCAVKWDQIISNGPKPSASLTNAFTFKKLVSVYPSMNSSTFYTVLARSTAFKIWCVVMML